MQRHKGTKAQGTIANDCKALKPFIKDATWFFTRLIVHVTPQQEVF